MWPTGTVAHITNDGSSSIDDIHPIQQPTKSNVPLWKRIEYFFDFRQFYFKIGYAIGEYPRHFLTLSMLLSLTSYGMVTLKFWDSVRQGYTALDARSRYETQVLREFLDMRNDPMEVVIMMLARDGGSMHRKAHLDEADQIVNAIFDITIKYNGQKLIYNKMCEPYCFTDELFKTFKHYYDVNYRSAVRNQYYSDLFNLSYPFASIYGHRIPLEQCLYGVRLVSTSAPSSSATSEVKSKIKRFFFDDNEIKVNLSKPIESQITNMEHVSLIVLFLYGNKNTTEQNIALSHWELGIHEYTKRYNKRQINQSSVVEVLIQGSKILDMEISEDHRKVSPYFSTGFVLMCSIVVTCLLSSSYYYNAVDFGKILIGVAAVLCPLLGITCSFGLLAMSVSRINSLLLVMPFLIMGIGVDASFLMMHSWEKMTGQNCNAAMRLGLVFEECGPSITISSMTNVLSFGIGALIPTPEIRLFCYGTATAVLLTYIFQILLFGSTLSIATAYERQYLSDDDDLKIRSWRNSVDQILLNCLRLHNSVVTRVDVSVVILLATIFFWYYALSGIFTMRIRLNSGKILAKDSYLHRPNSLLTSIVWKEHLSPILLVNRRFDITDTNITTQFWNMLKEMESLPHCKGPASTHVWLRAFAQKYSRTNDDYPYNVTLNPEKLPNFLKNDRRHFDMTVKLLNESGNITVKRFLFTMAFTNVSNWDIRIALMTQWRNVLEKYPDLNMTVYESAGYFVDQMLSLKAVTIQTALLTVASMTVVCAIFMRSVINVVMAAASMASISIGVIGLMSRMGFDLDPVVMIALLMTIGMSVDYIAHIAYHIQVKSRSVYGGGSMTECILSDINEQVDHALHSVAIPMLQAGFSTVFCILPLLFLPTYSSSVFVTAIILVVTLGFVHGLIILPTFLVRLPERFTRRPFGCFDGCVIDYDKSTSSVEEST